MQILRKKWDNVHAKRASTSRKHIAKKLKSLVLDNGISRSRPTLEVSHIGFILAHQGDDSMACVLYCKERKLHLVHDSRKITTS
jgi:hypothetical protein